jgi:hypothetical protein
MKSSGFYKLIGAPAEMSLALPIFLFGVPSDEANVQLANLILSLQFGVEHNMVMDFLLSSDLHIDLKDAQSE